MAMRVCRQPGCATLVTADTYRTLCPEHARQRDRDRGSREARGYGTTHRRKRTEWATRIAHSLVPCARCGQPITPTDDWHLGHTDDRRAYLGPEHARCNLSAAGKASHVTRMDAPGESQ